MTLAYKQAPMTTTAATAINTANRHIYAKVAAESSPAHATTCTYTFNIRLIAIYSLLFASAFANSSGGAFTVAAVDNSSAEVVAAAMVDDNNTIFTCEFRAFTDFLQQQHLRHAIVAYNGQAFKSLSVQQQQQQAQRMLRDFALHSPYTANIASLQFYDVHRRSSQQKSNNKNFVEFKKLFCSTLPRVGVYLAQLEDVLLQEYVLGTHKRNDSTTAIAKRGDGNGGGVVVDDTHSCFNNSQAWFIMSKEGRVAAALENVRRIMTPLPLNISADITLGVRIARNNTIQLFDIYKVQSDILEIEEKGYWSAVEGLKLKKHYLQTYIRRRRDFRSLSLRAGVPIIEKPANLSESEYLNTKDYMKFDLMQRKVYQMMRLFEPMFNASFPVKTTPSWGAQLPNGSWDGIVGMLVSNEIELSMGPMRSVSKRVGFIHYTPAVHTEYVYFIFRHPRRNDIRNIFFTPFVNDVWYAIIAIIVITVLLLQLHIHHEHRLSLNQDPHFEQRLDYAIISILEGIFLQGPDTGAFAATSTRTLIFFVSVFSMMLQQFYGAFIVGSLLAATPRTITTMEALANSSLEIGAENIFYNLEIFETAKLPIVKEMYARRICKNRERHVLTIAEGAKRIKEGGFAFHVSANRMYVILKEILNEQEFCDLQEISFCTPFHSGIGVAKNSPFIQHINSAILMLRTTGLMQYNDKQWQFPKLDCSLSQDSEVEVDLQHFLPALLLLLSAMLFSVVILGLELIYFRLERSFKLTQLFRNLLPPSQRNIEFIN